MDQLPNNPLPIASPQKPFPKWPFIAIFSFILGVASVLSYQKYLPSRIIPEGASPSPVAVLPSPSVDPTTFKFNDQAFDLTDAVKARAIQAAKVNGFIASDLEVDTDSILINSADVNKLISKNTIRIKSCTLNKTMHLDQNTFQVLKFIDEIWCGGIPGE